MVFVVQGLCVVYYLYLVILKAFPSSSIHKTDAAINMS